MKRLVLPLLLLALMSGCAPLPQQIPIENGRLAGILPMANGRVRYDIEESIPGVNGATLFRRIRQWCALHVENPGLVIEQSDNQMLEIIAPARLLGATYTERGAFPYVAGETDIAMVITVRDGGYTIIAGNFRVESGISARKGLTANITPRTRIEAPTVVTPDQYRAHFKDLDRGIAFLARSIRDFAVGGQ